MLYTLIQNKRHYIYFSIRRTFFYTCNKMRSMRQTLVFIFSCMVVILVQIADSTDAQPSHRRSIRDTSSGNSSGRLSVTVVRTAVQDFLKRNSNPEREIEGVERTSLSVRTSTTTHEEQTHSREPTWFSKHGGSTNSKKMKRRSRRKRQKRGAKVNKDATLISEYSTNARVYKYCNKLGFCLRLKPDGTVDGTRDRDDPFSKLNIFLNVFHKIYLYAHAISLLSMIINAII